MVFSAIVMSVFFVRYNIIIIIFKDIIMYCMLFISKFRQKLLYAFLAYYITTLGFTGFELWGGKVVKG